MKTVIEMAKESGWPDSLVAPVIMAKLTDFAELVRADERAACAKVCEGLVPNMSRTANNASVWDVATFDCASAIRARSKT